MAGFPVEKHTESFWLDNPSELAKLRTTPELPSEADVVIIGSGYAGAATAYYLLKDPPSRPSVIILEAREACSGATGRNGGHLKPDTYFGFPVYEKLFGPETAVEMTKFEVQQVMEVKKLVQEEQIDCDFELTRGVDVFLDRRNAQPVIEAYRSMLKDGHAIDDLHFVSDPKKAEQISGVKGALAAFICTAGHVWPYKFVSHLLRRAISWGANLQTDTLATSITPDTTKPGRWIVTTPRGSPSAKQIVLATNAYTGALLPLFSSKITPCRGTACHIAIPTLDPSTATTPNNKSHSLPPHLPNTYALRFAPKEYDYLIPRPTDGSIIVGGAKQVVLKDESLWRNNVNDNELIPGAEEYFTGYMQRHFRGWEDSGAELKKIWTGVMGYSSDLMPWVGEVPGVSLSDRAGEKMDSEVHDVSRDPTPSGENDKQKKGQESGSGIFVCAGFTGHGMSRILGCAKAVAALLSERHHSNHGAGSVHNRRRVTNEEIHRWIPKPYWITRERLEKPGDVVGEYMAGDRL